LGVKGLRRLGGVEELLGDLARRLQVSAICIISAESRQHWQKAWDVTELLAQRSGSGVRVLNFWRTVTLKKHRRRTESDLDIQFLQGMFRWIWEGCKHCQSRRMVSNRFDKR
jgi:hypothetical protein